MVPRMGLAAWKALLCGLWRKWASFRRRFAAETIRSGVLEFADVLAWLATLANIAGVDLEDAMRAKYGAGCPGCGMPTCICGTSEKP